MIITTGAGVILCIERALADAGISKEQINYINAHATSTPAGDLKEYQALAHCFGQNPEVALSSPGLLKFSLLGVVTRFQGSFRVLSLTVLAQCCR